MYERYYHTGRGIDEDLINACIHRDVLYETELYHNCVFIGHDENRIARYGCYRSTNDLKMMGDLAGSDKRYSFRTNSEGKELHVFESPIDLLSYMTLMNMTTGRWLAEPMLSLGGVYMYQITIVRSGGYDSLELIGNRSCL